jgi:hypothetical protein
VQITIELTDAQEEELGAQAARLGVPKERFIRAVVQDVLQSNSESFRTELEELLSRNEELYRRLA